MRCGVGGGGWFSWSGPLGPAQQHVAQEVELEISMQRVMAGQGAKRLPLKQLRQRARKTMHRGEAGLAGGNTSPPRRRSGRGSITPPGNSERLL